LKKVSAISKKKHKGILYKAYLQKAYMNKNSKQLKDLKSVMNETIDQVIEENVARISQVYAKKPAERFETDEVLYTHNVNGENIAEYFDISSKEEAEYGVLTKQLNQSGLGYNQTIDSKMNTVLSKQQQQQNNTPMFTPTSPFQSGNKENSYAKKYLSKKKKNSLNFDMPLRKEGTNNLNDSSFSQKINIKNL